MNDAETTAWLSSLTRIAEAACERGSVTPTEAVELAGIENTIKAWPHSDSPARAAAAAWLRAAQAVLHHGDDAKFALATAALYQVLAEYTR